MMYVHEINRWNQVHIPRIIPHQIAFMLNKLNEFEAQQNFHKYGQAFKPQTSAWRMDFPFWRFDPPKIRNKMFQSSIPPVKKSQIVMFYRTFERKRI